MTTPCCKQSDSNGLPLTLACTEGCVHRTGVTDTQRLNWLLPIVTGGDTPETNLRTMKLVAAIAAGLDERAAIDMAMKLS